jgi:hypothetical protein
MRAWFSCTCLGVALLVSACDGDDEDDTTGTGASGAAGTGAAGASGSGGGVGATGGSGASGAQGGDGGTSTGGTGGGGGAGGTATGGAGGAGGAPQCTEDTQCTNPNDCCTCEAFGPGEPLPFCNLPECVQSKCSEIGWPNAGATCSAGQCVAGFGCEHATVTCDGPMPVCGAGMTASVVGTCWGGCVKVTECATVSTCAQCTGGAACVTEVTQLGPQVHCVTPAAACNGTPTCACMGAAVCVGAFDTCEDSGGVISCSCPAC